MKIQCDKCMAIYNILDEKIKGRPIKFNCKRCGNVVRYRPESQQTPDGNSDMAADEFDDNAKTVFQPSKIAKPREAKPQTAEMQEAKPQAKAEKPKPRMTIEGEALNDQKPVGKAPWYLAYSKSKHGPLTVQQIEKHLLDKDIKGELYVWKSGFDSWKKLSDLPEFEGVLKFLQEAKAQAEEAAALIQAPPKVAQKKPKKKKKTDSKSSFTDLLKVELGDSDKDTKQSSSQVKIDISELMNKETDSAIKTTGKKKSGKKEITATLEEYRPPEKKKIPIIPIFILLVLFSLVIGTPLTLAYKHIIEIPGLDEAPYIGQYFKIEEVDYYAKLREQWEMLVKIDETKIAMQATKEAEEKERIKTEKLAAKREQQERRRRAEQRKQTYRGSGSKKAQVIEFDFGEGGDEMETEGELKTTNVARTKQLEQSEVNKVIRANMSRIAGCAAAQKEFGENVKGSMTVRFTISRRGSVVRANILTGKFKGTYVGDCVSSTIERLRFPKSGGSMTVNYPFSIQ